MWDKRQLGNTRVQLRKECRGFKVQADLIDRKMMNGRQRGVGEGLGGESGVNTFFLVGIAIKTTYSKVSAASKEGLLYNTRSVNNHWSGKHAMTKRRHRAWTIPKNCHALLRRR